MEQLGLSSVSDAMSVLGTSVTLKVSAVVTIRGCTKNKVTLTLIQAKTAWGPFSPLAHLLALLSHIDAPTLQTHPPPYLPTKTSRAVPLAPLFASTAGTASAAPPPTPTTAASEDDDDGGAVAVAGAREGVCASQEGGTPAAATAQQKTPPEAVVQGFQQVLEACRVRTPAAAAAAERGGASTSTLRLLDLLLKEGLLDRVRSMFAVSGGVDSGGGNGAAAAAELGEEEPAASSVTRPTEEQEWSRCVAVWRLVFFGGGGGRKWFVVYG